MHTFNIMCEKSENEGRMKKGLIAREGKLNRAEKEIKLSLCLINEAPCHEDVEAYTKCFTTLGHNCRR
jgi:hypothetical protein